ncbi:unnamed protein product [Rhodiola kirilowii]
MAIENRKTYFELIFLLLVFCCFTSNSISTTHFNIHEATIEQIHDSFAQSQLTARQLTDFYLHQIQTLNPTLRAVIEVNPEAHQQADEADQQWRCKKTRRQGLGLLHGIPVLLKDSIATKDKMNTTAGSYALLGSKVPRDAMVVEKLRRAGAVILGKASQTEWYQFRSLEKIPDGWCARSGQGVNPYVEMGNPGGSSSGSAISVAANMVAVSLGTETDGSILLPADWNSVVGIKPTVGLTSRDGVVPLSARMDTVGPICRTVSDAVHVLDAIVGYDPSDPEATAEAAKFIPKGGYIQFLNKDGLKGKRLGIIRTPFINSYINDSFAIPAFERHISTLRLRGAVVVDHLEIQNVNVILDPYKSGEAISLVSEFKPLFYKYLKDLISSPVRSLADIIAFNTNNQVLEKLEEYGQDTFLAAEMMNVSETEVSQAVDTMKGLCEEGLEKIMMENKLDAIVTLGPGVATVLAIGGFPGISVPAGHMSNGMPFGICFGGLRGSEPKLIEVAYGFEQATSVRRPPFLKTSNCDDHFQLLCIQYDFKIHDITIEQIHNAFAENKLTSRELVDFYLCQIETLNPKLCTVTEVNSEARDQADEADREWKFKNQDRGLLGSLHGIPVLNPYIATGDPCGSSSGSAISVPANMAAVSLATEVDGSIACSADRNSVVGIKPTIGLTSRAGIDSLLTRLGTVGPIGRTVSDAVSVLDVIVGYDPRDPEATGEAVKFIPKGGYKQFLNKHGLNGKRIAIIRTPYLESFLKESITASMFKKHMDTLRLRRATIVDNLAAIHTDLILDPYESAEARGALIRYNVIWSKFLDDLNSSSLAPPVLDMTEDSQIQAEISRLDAEMKIVSEFGDDFIRFLEIVKNVSCNAFEKLMQDYDLDAVVTLGKDAFEVLRMTGIPGITVPAGYEANGLPFGVCFSGLRGSEPTLIQVAYGFEQASHVRRPPMLSKSFNIEEHLHLPGWKFTNSSSGGAFPGYLAGIL